MARLLILLDAVRVPSPCDLTLHVQIPSKEVGGNREYANSGVSGGKGEKTKAGEAHAAHDIEAWPVDSVDGEGKLRKFKIRICPDHRARRSALLLIITDPNVAAAQRLPKSNFILFF